jgi:hypothetical protein
MTLLRQMTLTLHTPEGLDSPVPLNLNAKRAQLLAYIAWSREPVKRDRMLEHLFGAGRSDEEATPEKLAMTFASHKKFLRDDIRKAILRLNQQAGRTVLSEHIDIFEHKQQLWRLSSLCRVTDLEAVEAQYQVLQSAKKNGLLVDTVPPR